MFRGGSIPSARSEGVRFYEKVKGKDSSADVSDVKAPRALERRQQQDLYSPPFTERAHTLERENVVVNAPKNSAQIQKEKVRLN